jgi:hypothetical protein
VELDFLVESGLGFGFILGLGQMMAWVMKPKPWTLPVSYNNYMFAVLYEEKHSHHQTQHAIKVAGAIVGYVTNW